jgi:hypothetical protein
MWKCSYAKDIIKGGPMMWMSCAMDGNRQKEKWLFVKLKALKWAKANSAFSRDHFNGFPW